MGTTQPDYRLGRILGAYLRTKTGGRELHPAVILSSDAEIVQPERFDPRSGEENLIAVAGVTTKYRLHPEPFIELPHAPTGHAVTKLKKDCAAIIGWYHVLSIPDDVRFFAGDVPTPVMVKLNAVVRADLVTRFGRQFDSLAEIRSLLSD